MCEKIVTKSSGQLGKGAGQGCRQPALRQNGYQGMAVLVMAVLLASSCTQSPQAPGLSWRRTSLTSSAAQPLPVADPNQIVWHWQPKALHLSITASPTLNRYEGQPHALMLCLYQLSSAASFNELSKNSTGINTLLQCEGFDGSVVQSKRLLIQPGRRYPLVLDRLEKGRHVALVAGYARQDAKRLSPIASFPIIHYSERVLFWKKDYYLPGELDLNLVLTEQSLQLSDLQ